MADDKPEVAPETYETAASFSSDDPTFKFYQVSVPTFAFNQTGDQTGVTRTVPNVSGDPEAGSSFIRLGSFPDLTQPGKGPPGFAASLGLANIIGDATKIPTAMDGLPFTYNGDPAYLLGFANDSRVQKTALAENQGFAETKVLLTKGGWWDHSDGNRISTTLGDKIEVIQGNYKMVVVGRQTDPTLAVIRDHSGGMSQENNQTPSNCVKSIEFTQLYGGEWSIYEYNGIGNVYSAFYGNTGEVYFGKLKESWTGKDPGDVPPSEFYTDSLARDPDSGAISGNEDPDIKDYTWAKSITSYTGSQMKPVPTITEYTFADSITTTTGSAAKRIGSIVESTYADATTSTTDVSGAVTETTTVGGTITSTTTVGGAITEATTVGGAITSATTAPVITETTTVGVQTNVTLAGDINEVTLAAAKTSVFVGASVRDIEVAVKAEIFIGGRLSIDLGGAIEIALPDCTHISIPDKTDVRLDHLETSLTHIASSLMHLHTTEEYMINAINILLGF